MHRLETCPSCRGLGELMEANGENEEPVYMSCPECRGSGYLSYEELDDYSAEEEEPYCFRFGYDEDADPNSVW